jgi:hypothetical protein
VHQIVRLLSLFDYLRVLASIANGCRYLGSQGLAQLGVCLAKTLSGSIPFLWRSLDAAKKQYG